MPNTREIFKRDKIVTFAGVRPKRSRNLRRESNQEIMHRTQKKLGYVKVRILPCLYDATNTYFVALRGEAVTINLRNAADVKELMIEVRAAIERVGRRIAKKVRGKNG